MTAARSQTIVRAARWRVPLGFVVGPLVVWLAQPTLTSVLVGGIVASVGEALRIWAAGHLNKSREVTTSGPYRWNAHPLYVGSSVMGLGLAVASNQIVAAVLIAVYMSATIILAIKSEEAFLREKFGDRYDSYRRGTQASAARDSDRRFSLAQAMANREYRAIAGFAVVLVLLLLKVMLAG